MSFFKGCSRQKECLILSVLLVFWVALRLPNISHPLSLKMDAASAGVAWFIDESWTHQPLTRWFAPVDHRTQWGELETGKLAPYLHVPPFALVPLGLWIQGFGKSEASLRSGGICASVLFAFLSYLSCRFWLGPWQGFGVITLMMICPQSLHYSRNVDPMITNVVWLPCMLLAYQVFERRKTSWSLSVFIWVSSCAMLSYWCSFGVFLFIVLWHFFHRHSTLKLKLIFALCPCVVLALILGYHVLVWGGWEHFVNDFTYTLTTRTVSSEISWGSFFTLELQRMVRNYGCALTLWACIGLHRAWPISTWRFWLFVWAGCFLFPLFVRRTTSVHEYFTYWTLLPLCVLAFRGMSCISGKNIWTRAILLISLVSLVFQSGWVGYNRMVHYDKDYLLSQALGRAAKQHLNGAVLLTDCQDNEHVFQYYSEAQCFLHTNNVATIEKALAVYAKSGRREPMYFISTTADQVKRIIPDLQAFPDGKFTGEFDLEENKNTPLWQYLVNHFQSQDVNGFTAFRLTP